MAQLLQAFDATQVDPTQGGASLPVGKHPVIITESSIDENKAGNGGFLALTLRITAGPCEGQEGVYRLNLYNQSPKACEIAQKQLSAISHVTGVFRVTDSQQLHGIPFVIEVGMQKGEEAAAKGYTEVKRVFDINGNEPGKAGGAGQGQGQQPQGGGAAWGQQPQGGQQQPQGAAGGGWGQQPQGQQPQGQQPGAQGGGWGGQPQQQPQGQPQGQGGAAWGGGNVANNVPMPNQQPQQQPQQPQGNGGAPSWGAPGGQQQPQQQQPQGGGWQQQQPQGNPPAWGAPR